MEYLKLKITSLRPTIYIILISCKWTSLYITFIYFTVINLLELLAYKLIIHYFL